MLKVYYQVSRYKADGSLKSKSRERLSRSFVKQFLQLLYCAFVGSDSSGMTIVDTAGNSNSGGNSNISLYASHPGGNSYKGMYAYNEQYSCIYLSAPYMGITVGTGVGAVNMSDNFMGTYIPNGKGSGELEYLSCAVHSYAESDPNASFALERFFRNGSGDTVSINEVGVCATRVNKNIGGENATVTYLIIRDLVSPAENVANGEYLKITYTFQIEA